MDASGPLGLEDYQGEGGYCEGCFNPVECWIAFKQEGGSDHSQCKN